MGFLVHGIESDLHGKFRGYPSFYIETDEKAQAIAEAMRRGITNVNCVPVACRPPCFDAVTGDLVITRGLRIRLWLASFGPDLRFACYILLFVGGTAAFLLILAYFGVDSRSRFERQKHEQQIRDVQRNR